MFKRSILSSILILSLISPITAMNKSPSLSTMDSPSTPKLATSQQETPQDRLNKDLYWAVSESVFQTLGTNNSQNIDKIKKLVLAGANSNIQCILEPYGLTSLMYATQLGNEEIFEFFITHGTDVNYQNARGRTALMSAVWSTNDVACKLLLEHGAALQTADEAGVTALIESAYLNSERGHIILKTLITHPIFNPIRTDEQLQTSRERIWAALCGFKRVCPGMPRDIRHFILNQCSELLEDTRNCAFGIHKQQHNRMPLLALPVIKKLIQGELVNPESTIAALKEHHLTSIKPLMRDAYRYALSNDIYRALLKVETMEEVHGSDIEAVIRERLGLAPAAAPQNHESKKKVQSRKRGRDE